MNYRLICADVLDGLRTLDAASIDAIVTDPPYGLGFMGVGWDTLRKGGAPRSREQDFDVLRSHEHPRNATEQSKIRAKNNFTLYEFSLSWAREALRVLKPGGHLLAFGGSRTYHRLACAVEDAGFEIRDQIQWIYGSGFPKSLDVSKAIDKAAGAERDVVCVRSQPDIRGGSYQNRARNEVAGNVEIRDTTPATDAARQWQGWGTALKPAHEPIVVARKPLVGTVATNVQKFGTGALNIDGCRIEGVKPVVRAIESANWNHPILHTRSASGTGEMSDVGRWPANVILDEEAAAMLDEQSGESTSGAMRRDVNSYDGQSVTGMLRGRSGPSNQHGDSGGASRFFYTAKADNGERNDGMPGGMRNHHPTVKPISVMRWLVRLVTPKGGVVLDPFCGSGSTGCAAVGEGFGFIGIEQEPGYLEIARARIANIAPLFSSELACK